MIERRYGVWLSQTRVGWLDQRGDHTWFTLADEYLTDPHRAVLGLVFEDNPTVLHSSHMRLPPWFSNLLPEGRLREWIALDRHVSPDREMELLAQVGADLPGAVRILDEGGTPGPLTGTGIKIDANAVDLKADPGTWRFSLAGVGLKFSML